ncbi:MAG: sulfatase-like hydrolase/transferase [Actinobacteria bacterium]|nr:sulfatase-like hydrolase/transferase [Actinomycetota bacterium]
MRRPTIPAPLRRGTRARFEIARLLELVGLSGLVVIQPVLPIFGAAGDDLVARRLTAAQLVFFAFVLLLVPPVLLWGATALFALRSRPAELAAHKIVLAILAGLLVPQTLGRAGLAPIYCLILGLLVAAGAAFLLFRWDALRAWPRYLSVAALLFVSMFLFASEATPIVLSARSASSLVFDTTAGNPIPIVMVVFDELPATSLLDGKGGIDASLFPNFAALAKDSTWFRNFSTVAAGSNWAIPAMTTGNLPASLAAPTSAVYTDSLFTMLGGTYEMDVQEIATQLCDPSICAPYSANAGDMPALLSRASQLWLDPIRGNNQAAVADETPNSARFDTGNPLFFLPEDAHDPTRTAAFVNSLRLGGDATLHFAHFLLPHLPWELTPNGRVCGDGRPQFPIGADQWTGQWTSSYGASSARARHLQQLQYTDAQLGKMIAELKATGLWDRAAIVIAGDHGVSFRQGQLRAFTEENWQDLLYVPVFMRGPGLTPGTVDDRNATSMDIVPTFADMLQMQVPYPVTGRSLLRAPDTSSVRKAMRNTKDTIAPKGAFVEFDAAEGKRRVLASRAAPPGNDDLRIYRFGDYASLIGRDVNSLPKGPPPSVTATVEGNGLTRTFDPSASTLDCFVTGTTSPGATGQLAVALNNTVVAVVPLAELGGKFWAVLPESRFTPGPNQVSLFLVDGTPANPRLAPVGAA